MMIFKARLPKILPTCLLYNSLKMFECYPVGNKQDCGSSQPFTAVNQGVQVDDWLTSTGNLEQNNINDYTLMF